MVGFAVDSKGLYGIQWLFSQELMIYQAVS